MLLLLLLPFFNAWSIGDAITSRRTSSDDDDIGVEEWRWVIECDCWSDTDENTIGGGAVVVVLRGLYGLLLAAAADDDTVVVVVVGFLIATGLIRNDDEDDELFNALLDDDDGWWLGDDGWSSGSRASCSRFITFRCSRERSSLSVTCDVRIVVKCLDRLCK